MRPVIYSFLGLLVLGACAHHDPFQPTAANSLYYCDQNNQIIISIADQADLAAIAFEGRNLTLEQIDYIGVDQAYTNNIFTLYYDEDDQMATLEREGTPYFTNCRQ